MAASTPSFAGVELYFDDLETAKRFYARVLGLEVAEEQSGHFAKSDSGSGFICLERKGVESYPSFIQVEPARAVLHDPEGHNRAAAAKGEDALKVISSAFWFGVKMGSPDLGGILVDPAPLLLGLRDGCAASGA